MRSPTATTPRSADPGRRSVRRRAGIPVVVAVVVVLLAELGARATASDLGSPQVWSTPELEVKTAQITAQHRQHRTGGVVFLSTSLLDVGVNPAAFVAASHTTLPVYDGSVSGANIAELRWWTDHVLIPELAPRYVVVGVSSRELNANDPQAAQIASQFFASDPVRHLSGNETVLQWLNRTASRYSDLFKYRTVLRSPRTAFQPSIVDGQRKYFTGPTGQELALAGQTYRGPGAEDAEFSQNILHNFAISPAKVAQLTSLLQDLTAAGIHTTLIDVPVTSDYIDLHPRKDVDFAAYESQLAAVVAATHVAFIPGQVWPTVDFADPLHLNRTGALRLGTELGQQLGPSLTG